MSDLTKRLRGRIISASLRNDKTGVLEMREIRDPLCVEAADRIDKLEECLRELAAMTAAQAEDEGLWFNAMHASEGYLQQELRKLHAAIENKARALLDEK